MPVEQVPGFWDYLGQGIQKGVAMHREDTQRAQEESHRKVAEAQGNAGLMTQLFNSGAVDSSQLQGALEKAGINPGTVQVQPNKAQRRRAVLAQGQSAVDALSDAEKEDLGFKSTAEIAGEKAKVSGANLEAQRNDLLSKYLAGDKLTDQEAQGVGVLSNSDMELKKLTQMDPYLGQLGERYVAGVMVQNKGRINPGTAQQTAEQAYTNYVAERSQNGLGTLTPEQVAYTRQYFNRATENALIAQQKMDIDKYQAESGRIHANAATAAAGMNTNLKWFSQMSTAMEGIRKAQADLMKANPALGPALDNPQLAASPMIKGALQRYQQLEQTAEAFRGAQGSLANGQVPGNLSALLEAAGGMMTQGAGPVGAPGGGVKPPAGGGKGGGPGGPPPGPTGGMDAGKIDQMAQMLVSGQGSAQQLQAAVSQGALSKEQYDKIMARAQALQRQSPKK